MSTIPLLARRRLCNTFNAQEVGQLRAALQDAGVEFVITQDSRPVGGFSGYGTSGPALHLGAGAAPFEYTVYVHKDDLALADPATPGPAGQPHTAAAPAGRAALFFHMLHAPRGVSSFSSISAAGRS